MKRTLKISTYLAADLETVKSYLMTPALLNYVSAGLMGVMMRTLSAPI